nr:hypothetical protein [Bacteroides congonensis]
MKKILLTLLLALPFCMVAKAQDFRVGITGGYNLKFPEWLRFTVRFPRRSKGRVWASASDKRPLHGFRTDALFSWMEESGVLLQR